MNPILCLPEVEVWKVGFLLYVLLSTCCFYTFTKTLKKEQAIKSIFAKIVYSANSCSHFVLELKGQQVTSFLFLFSFFWGVGGVYGVWTV